MSETKKIKITSLAMRFYVDDWNLDILNKYLLKGSFGEMDFNGKDKYFILNVGSEIDVNKILIDYPDVEVIPFSNSEKHLSKKTLLESRNWHI